MNNSTAILDGNEAAAYVAHKTNEVIAIYPITPSSGMGEWADQWSAEGKKNIWGTIPVVTEMQSEGGASGAVHGALQTGALTTTFTASQGLLLMIPNMFKIAGELTPAVFHVSARTVATHALSIFGDHSDVMATRTTGWGHFASGSIQEIMDFALIAQAATLKARVPIVHFFDGFRSSHEVQKIERLGEDIMRGMIDDELVFAHRSRALSPDHPVLRGSAQNPDVFFQARETVNQYYWDFPGMMQETMDKFAGLTGRHYHLFDYIGHPEAERVLILMGSGAEAAHEAVEALTGSGERVGLIKVRLYRPFSVKDFVHAIPPSTKTLTVLDRTKEPGAAGEPLYCDAVTAISEALAEGTAPFDKAPRIVGGRYGLSSKEFTPAMIKGVFDDMAGQKPKNHFTIGIKDDVTHTSIDYDPAYVTERDDTVRAVFFGLGSDGTVGANKNSIKIIGEETDNFVQGYFVYDSKKAGSVTVSHLRFGPRPIRSTYLISKASFVGCHQFTLMEKYDVLEKLQEGGTFLLNSIYGADEVWDKLTRKVQQQIIDKKAKFYVIDGYQVAQDSGMGRRINSVMQTCFFAISGILPRDEAIAKIKEAIKKTYGRKGDEVVRMNWTAVDNTLANMHEVQVPDHVTSTIDEVPIVSPQAPDFVREVAGEILAGRGDMIPVGMFPVDGTFPLSTARWEKRNIALEIPVWEPDICIECGKCAIVCPHATIRIKVYDEKYLKDAPPTFKIRDARDREWKGQKYTIQVAPEDCTGCGICVDICPAKSKKETRLKALNMHSQPPLRESERENWDYFLKIPDYDRRKVRVSTVKHNQLLEPLFEFSGACAGCGETPYVKLLTQLFGDRALIANATGCSSIYGGNLPTTPYAANADGRGPAWSNSLFEDNAEFGLGFRLTVDRHSEFAGELLSRLRGELGDTMVDELIHADQSDEAGIYEQRERVAALRGKLKGIDSAEARQLVSIADMLVKKSVWIVGGDGWAYDIGYGGLDHVLASGRNVNVLVLDTEVYSNTGGQMSKSTPRGGVAKFAAAGKPAPKKDLALQAMTYGNVYVARVAMGAKDVHTLRSFIEAEAYNGPSLIIAYSHCIAHGIDMGTAMNNQQAAVDCGHWPLFRYNPDLTAAGENPLKLDSGKPKIPVKDYMAMENRFRMLTKSNPERARMLWDLAQKDADARWTMLEHLAAAPGTSDDKT